MLWCFVVLSDVIDRAMEQQSTATPEVRNIVNFLRSSKAGIKVRVGVLNGKRIDYFKGE